MAYLPKLNPTVGGGLGGLPERRVVTPECPTIPQEKKYSFVRKDSIQYSINHSSVGTVLYFSDTNIYFAGSGSNLTYYKTTLDRTTKTFSTPVSSGSISGVSSVGYFDILVNDTFLVSSTTGEKITRSGDTLTRSDFCLPRTGTTTLDSISYNINSSNNIVRAIPNSTDYIVLGLTDSNNVDAYSIIFRVDKNFNVLSSSRITRSSIESINQSSFDFFITDEGIGVFSVNSNSNTANCSVVTISLTSLSIISSANISSSSYDGAGIAHYTCIFDRKSNTLYKLNFANISSGYAYALQTVFVKISSGGILNINDYSTISNNSFTSVGLNHTYVLGSKAQTVVDLTRQISYQYFNESFKCNKYGNPIVFFGLKEDTSYNYTLPYAVPSFTEDSIFTFSAIYKLYPYTNYTYNYIQNSFKYVPFYTSYSGYKQTHGSCLVPIGDNLYIHWNIMGMGGTNTHLVLFERLESV